MRDRYRMWSPGKHWGWGISMTQWLEMRGLDARTESIHWFGWRCPWHIQFDYWPFIR